MAVTGAGANYAATVAERNRGCVFARSYTRMSDIVGGSGFASYSFSGLLGSAFPFVSRSGALFVDMTDNIQHRHEEFREPFTGAGKAFSGVAEINRYAYTPGGGSGVRGMILFAGLTSNPGFAFGFDDSDPPKLTVGFNNFWTVSTAADPFVPDNLGTPGGRHIVGFTLTTAGTVTFYVNGVQLGNPVNGVTTPATLGAMPIIIVTGNNLNDSAPLFGWVRWARWYLAELSAAEHARYAGVTP
jgi:hypothetical protein